MKEGVYKRVKVVTFKAYITYNIIIILIILSNIDI
jgi:hypothetical protein